MDSKLETLKCAVFVTVCMAGVLALFGGFVWAATVSILGA